ncbi:MAG: N-acetyltransferase [Neisseriaceae bacterium]|nr:N-acetyltransferase [Neisseriaceae bacterium]
MNLVIRKEYPEDIDSITQLITVAFKNEEYSSHTEQFIVKALRSKEQLTVSLVAVEGGKVVGHVAISPVQLSTGTSGWYGLGPISVLPDHQGQGVGSALMKAALTELEHAGGIGCVVLGDPNYYGRFGFKTHPELELPGVPQEYFQAKVLVGELPKGTVQYHKAFEAIE